MAERVFTLAEARRTLPDVAAMVIVMRRRVQRLDELNALASSLERTTSADGAPVETDDRALREEIAKVEEQIRALIEQITRMGVEIKDIRRGLVDWVAMREGREVYLCWQAGERAIGWWHEIADGFAGRRRVDPGEWD